MIAEHLVYNAAIAIIIGLMVFRYTGRDTSWIIILVTYIPDLDKITGALFHRIGITVLVEGQNIQHGTFHNIAAMIIISVVLGFLLHPFGIRYFDTFVMSMIGLGSHLFEDALVYSSDYAYLWPFSHARTGLGWLPISVTEESYRADFFQIANTEVLLIGLVFLLTAVLVRTRIEGSFDWIRWYMPESVYRKIFLKKKYSTD